MKEKKVRKTVESERQIEMLHSLCLPVHVYKIEQYGEDSLTCRSISPFSPIAIYRIVKNRQLSVEKLFLVIKHFFYQK